MCCDLLYLLIVLSNLPLRILEEKEGLITKDTYSFISSAERTSAHDFAGLQWTTNANKSARKAGVNVWVSAVVVYHIVVFLTERSAISSELHLAYVRNNDRHWCIHSSAVTHGSDLVFNFIEFKNKFFYRNTRILFHVFTFTWFTIKKWYSTCKNKFSIPGVCFQKLYKH